MYSGVKKSYKRGWIEIQTKLTRIKNERNILNSLEAAELSIIFLIYIGTVTKKKLALTIGKKSMYLLQQNN